MTLTHSAMRHTTLYALAGLAMLAVAGCSHSPPPAPAPARRAPAARPVPVTAAPVRASAEAMAEDVITRTNAERRAAHLAPLTPSANLMRAAALQATQMARSNRLDHDIPGAAYPTLGSRLAFVQYPMRAAGENIGEGYHTPSAAVAAWMGSAGHRANILSANYTEIGTAIAPGPNGSMYWVQVFGRPR